MSIFKFTTTKPSASKIWTTLMETTIAPREGYSVEQIKYRMFIMLQLAEDFKTAVSYCNRVISTPMPITELLTTTCRMTAADESDFTDLSVSSETFPHWVEPELYTPYYLTKQLCIKQSDDKLLFSLFDRSTLQPGETAHIVTDRNEAPGLTAYKLYNSTTTTPAMDWINISYNQNPLQVSSKDELKMHIRGELLDALEHSDNFIIPDGSKITIPYFILDKGTSDASQ